MPWSTDNLSFLNTSDPVAQFTGINDLTYGLLGGLVPGIIFVIAFTTLRRNPYAQTHAVVATSALISLMAALPLLVAGVVTWAVYGFFIALYAIAVFWAWQGKS